MSWPVCPFCRTFVSTGVIDSRWRTTLHSVYRRYSCVNGHRFSTIEVIDLEAFMPATPRQHDQVCYCTAYNWPHRWTSGRCIATTPAPQPKQRNNPPGTFTGATNGKSRSKT